MCGRYTIYTTGDELADHFGLDTAPDLAPRYNVAPTQEVPTVVVITDRRRCRLMRWGLIPHWADDEKIGNRMINARAETVDMKPAFRKPLRRGRCLVMADGFYEWKKGPGGKQPFYVTRCDDAPFAFAGLWDQWDSHNAGRIESCTIITTDANELISPLHNRMPVIVDPRDYDRWLDADLVDTRLLKEMLKPYPSDELKAYPVGKTVNSPVNESPRCIEPQQ